MENVETILKAQSVTKFARLPHSERNGGPRSYLSNPLSNPLPKPIPTIIMPSIPLFCLCWLMLRLVMFSLRARNLVPAGW